MEYPKTLYKGTGKNRQTMTVNDSPAEVRATFNGWRVEGGEEPKPVDLRSTGAKLRETDTAKKSD
jgi:hypothetical protein